jgi:hypothetical protein
LGEIAKMTIEMNEVEREASGKAKTSKMEEVRTHVDR